MTFAVKRQLIYFERTLVARGGSVTVGQLFILMCPCFMSSRSGFLHTFCVYVVHEFMFSELERRPVRRVTIICQSRD